MSRSTSPACARQSRRSGRWRSRARRATGPPTSSGPTSAAVRRASQCARLCGAVSRRTASTSRSSSSMASPATGVPFPRVGARHRPGRPPSGGAAPSRASRGGGPGARRDRGAIGRPCGPGRVVLLGQRPGLSSPDRVGAYLTSGRAPAVRRRARLVSNIRPAACLGGSQLLAWLVRESLRRRLSGVEFEDDRAARRRVGARRLYSLRPRHPDGVNVRAVRPMVVAQPHRYRLEHRVPQSAPDIQPARTSMARPCRCGGCGSASPRPRTQGRVRPRASGSR